MPPLNEPVAIGTLAPDFTLKSYDEQNNKMVDVTLSANRGCKNTVLFFVPAAFSPACTKEACQISMDLPQMPDRNADIVIISADLPWALSAWGKSQNLDPRIKLASDSNLQATAAYGVVLDHPIGKLSQRAVFVIDEAGIIAHVQVTRTPKDLPDFNLVTAVLADLSSRKVPHSARVSLGVQAPPTVEQSLSTPENRPAIK